MPARSAPAISATMKSVSSCLIGRGATDFAPCRATEERRLDRESQLGRVLLKHSERRLIRFVRLERNDPGGALRPRGRQPGRTIRLIYYPDSEMTRNEQPS